MWGGRPDEEGEVIFHAQCRLRTLADALLSELQRLQRTTGLPGIARSGSNMTSRWDGWMSYGSYSKIRLIVILLRGARYQSLPNNPIRRESL